MRAARYLNVPPWELSRQSVTWLHYAEEAEREEEAAREYHRRRNRRKQGKGN